MSRPSTSRTPTTDIIQGIVDSTQDAPPFERAPTAVEETPADDHSAPVSFSAPDPITTARLASFSYGNSHESDTGSEASGANTNNETSASTARNDDGTNNETSASTARNKYSTLTAHGDVSSTSTPSPTTVTNLDTTSTDSKNLSPHSSPN